MVIWSYKTTSRSNTGESPFLLTYGCEAMVPVKGGAGSFSRDRFSEEANMVNHGLHMDFLEEVRQITQLRLVAYHQRTTRYFNRKVKFRPFQIGDLVLKKVMPHTKTTSHGVFDANWEGPYKICSVLWEGTYHLSDLNGNRVPKPWNTEHLKKYY